MQCRGVLQVVDIPVVTQRLIPMVRVTIEISQFRVGKVVDALFYAGRADFLSWCRGRFPMVLTVQRTIETPQLLIRTSLS